MSSAAAADPAKLAPCLAQAAPADTCVRDFVNGFAGRAYRRDLTSAETQGLVDQYKRARTGGADGTAAIRQLLMAVLTSPNFLFRTEMGEEGGTGATVALTGFERASALSYFLTDGPPDAELLQAARSGSAGRQGRARETDPAPGGQVAPGAGLERMLRELYQTAAPRSTDKDEMLFPEWKTELAEDLAREGEAFMQQVAVQRGRQAGNAADRRLHHGEPRAGDVLRPARARRHRVQQGEAQGGRAAGLLHPGRPDGLAGGERRHRRGRARAVHPRGAAVPAPAAAARQPEHHPPAPRRQEHPARAAGQALGRSHLRQLPQADGPAGPGVRELRLHRAVPHHGRGQAAGRSPAP